MARTLDQRTHDLAVLSELVVELVHEATGTTEMSEDVVELVVELEARMARALGVTSPSR
jgi:gamma-glutamyl:cysteine ligase YbdK (ATP-grasp superfamily)